MLPYDFGFQACTGTPMQCLDSLRTDAVPRLQAILENRAAGRLDRCLLTEFETHRYRNPSSGSTTRAIADAELAWFAQSLATEPVTRFALAARTRDWVDAVLGLLHPYCAPPEPGDFAQLALWMLVDPAFDRNQPIWEELLEALDPRPTAGDWFALAAIGYRHSHGLFPTVAYQPFNPAPQPAWFKLVANRLGDPGKSLLTPSLGDLLAGRPAALAWCEVAAPHCGDVPDPTLRFASLLWRRSILDQALAGDWANAQSNGAPGRLLAYKSPGVALRVLEALCWQAARRVTISAAPSWPVSEARALFQMLIHVCPELTSTLRHIAVISRELAVAPSQSNHVVQEI